MWNPPTAKQLEKLPRLYSSEKVSTDDKKLFMHFFIGGTDWWVAEYDPEEKLFFGYTILNSDVDMAEWGYISLEELRSLHVGPLEVDRDLHFKPRTFRAVMQDYHLQRPELRSHEVAKEIAKEKQDSADTCYRCGGKTKFYDGALGYEAMKCEKCGHEYSETSIDEYEKNKKDFLSEKKKHPETTAYYRKIAYDYAGKQEHAKAAKAYAKALKLYPAHNEKDAFALADKAELQKRLALSTEFMHLTDTPLKGADDRPVSELEKVVAFQKKITPSGRGSVVADAQKAEAQRSPQSRSMDERRANQKRLPLTRENLEKWKKDPGRYDLEGIDTIKKIARLFQKVRKIKTTASPTLAKYDKKDLEAARAYLKTHKNLYEDGPHYIELQSEIARAIHDGLDPAVIDYASHLSEDESLHESLKREMEWELAEEREAQRHEEKEWGMR